MGVEPTMDTVGYPSTDLKSAKLTGAPSPPKAMLDSPQGHGMALFAELIETAKCQSHKAR